MRTPAAAVRSAGGSVLVFLLQLAAFGTAARATPNLTPFRPDGWSNAIVVNHTAGLRADQTLQPGDAGWVNWAVLNDGDETIHEHFTIELWFDGKRLASWVVDEPIAPYVYVYLTGGYPLGPLAAGTHTVTVKADTTGAVAESSETDNQLTRTFVVGSGGAGACGKGELCLEKGRFAAKLTWRAASGATSTASPIPLAQRSGIFALSKGSVEAAIKVVDGRAVNHRYWVFYSGLTDLELTLQVRDTKYGRAASYFKPKGKFASAADTATFVDAASTASASLAGVGEPARLALGHAHPARRWSDDSASWLDSNETAAALPRGTCVPTSTTLCLLNRRFQVRVTFVVPNGPAGPGNAMRWGAEPPATQLSDAGYFWFFDKNLAELVVKMVDGTNLNGHFAFYSGGLSDVRYAVTVTDTITHQAQLYVNPAGQLTALAHLDAFPPPSTPLLWNAPALIPATVGFPYLASLCAPVPGSTTDLCGGQLPPAAGANPSGGTPPYHFEKDIGAAFLPFGLRLNLDGLITGQVDSRVAPGNYATRICAVDMGGHRVCHDMAIVVSGGGGAADVVPGNYHGQMRVTASQSCGTPAGNWTATNVHLANGHLLGAWDDSFDDHLGIDATLVNGRWTWDDGLGITYRATFRADGSVDGDFAGDDAGCGPTSGTFDGHHD